MGPAERDQHIGLEDWVLGLCSREMRWKQHLMYACFFFNAQGDRRFPASIFSGQHQLLATNKGRPAGMSLSLITSPHHV